MKLLIILGSPRKKDTYNAINMFQERYKSKYPNTDFELLYLMKQNLRDCVGCHNCVTRGHEFCPESKKISEIVTKMKKAHGIVFATPIYSEFISYLMKKLIDYLSFLYHRPFFFGTQMTALITGSPIAKNCLKYLKKISMAWGGTWISGISIPHYESLTPKYRKKTDSNIESWINRFQKAIVNKKKLSLLSTV